MQGEEFLYDYISSAVETENSVEFKELEPFATDFVVDHHFDLDENSAIPEVAATVPITDQIELPVLTLRFWLLSTFFTLLAALIGQYFYFRYNSMILNGFCLILLSYPFGLLLSKIPKKSIGWTINGTFYGFHLNPGPFNIKEQCLIVITASAAMNPAYAIDLLSIQRLYFSDYDVNMGWIGSLLLLLTTQCLGLGLAGFFRKLLVEPASMWWPSNLVFSNLLHTLHGKSTSLITSKRLHWFKWVFVVAFVYQFLPGFLMPILQSIAFLCLFSNGPSGALGNSLIWPATLSPIDPRPMLAQMGSGLNGGGVFSFSLDWQSIGVLAPMYTPLWAQLNYFFANYAFSWLIVPLLFKYNVWDAQLFPMYSTDAFTVNGTLFNVSQILNPSTLTVDEQKYQLYSELRLSPFWAFSYGCSFAALSAIIVHIVLYHGEEIYDCFKNPSQDVHTKLMKKYEAVPLLWFGVLFVMMLALSFVTVLQWKRQLQIEWWGLCIALFLAFVFILPVGIVQAISNKQIGLNVLTEFIMGFIQPGAPLANATFKTYGHMTVSQSLKFLSDMKLGHYMKIPPKAVFIAQLYGTFIGCIVNYAVFEFLIKENQDIWKGIHHDALTDSQWRATSPRIFYTASVLWGAMGSLRQIGYQTMYSPLLWFFLAGALIPIPFYFLFTRFPNAGFQYIHWPIIFESVGSTADGTANALFSASLVAILFQFGLRIYKRNWYDLYNYTTSAALDSGTVLAAIVIYLTLNLSEISEKYNFNALHPNPQIWQTPEYCYNTSSVA